MGRIVFEQVCFGWGMVEGWLTFWRYVCDCVELMKFQCFVYRCLSGVPGFPSTPDCICWKNGG